MRVLVLICGILLLSSCREPSTIYTEWDEDIVCYFGGEKLTWKFEKKFTEVAGSAWVPSRSSEDGIFIKDQNHNVIRRYSPAVPCDIRITNEWYFVVLDNGIKTYKNAQIKLADSPPYHHLNEGTVPPDIPLDTAK